MELIANADAATLSPVALFLQADWVVKGVMLGLLAASIWTWAIIFAVAGRLRRTRKGMERFEQDFRKAEDIDAFHRIHAESALPVAQVFTAGVGEWRRSTAGKTVDKAGTRERLATAMGAAAAQEVDKLSDRLNVLATVGSVAPFVGLFGTVWGIMRAFTAIAGAQNSSLAVVAPGIAEALFATAIGLFAAIPAVIAYNRFSHGINKVEARLNRFADGFHATLSRQLDFGGLSAMAMNLPSQRGRGRRAPMADINVTPLVDVMLVLLIIFMVTAPLLTAGVPVNLPDSRAKPLEQEQQPIDMAVDADGRIFIDKTDVTATLPDALAAIAARNPPDKPPQVFLRADTGLGYGRVMAVMGELNRAGLNRVALVTNANEGGGR